MKLEALETARLRIRQFSLDDLDNCLRFRREVFGVDDGEANAQRWLTWTIDSYRELAGLGQPPYADYAVERRGDGCFVGAVGIVPTVVPWGALRGEPSDALLSPEIGLFWGIMPACRRRGYAGEAAAALLDYLFTELKARQVVATTERDNIASQRVMEKLGMTLLHSPTAEPRWRQVVGLIQHPRVGKRVAPN
ncbi:MAG: GNAT family N-acetyltransferase [Chloroflexi bacterium]|nr:GNAT family N-acetyltransferase [Chloroflexota bacterium]